MMQKTPIKRKRKRRVKEPLTDELLDELLEAPDPVKFAERHHITQRNLAEYLQQLLDEKGLVRATIVREAGLGATYGYQIFTGKRTNPSRNIILQLAFAMKCTITEANRMLQAAGCNELYCKNRRDAILIFCLNKGYSLQETERELYRFGEPTLNEEPK